MAQSCDYYQEFHYHRCFLLVIPEGILTNNRWTVLSQYWGYFSCFKMYFSVIPSRQMESITYVAISLQKCKFLELNEKKALSLLISVIYVSMCVMYGSLIKIPCGACVPSKYQL